ncbi:hypothetical protein AB4510_01310 [Vibrio sp. 10N.222.54.B12]|uniref:GapS4b family protein n=1 Tax=Vibrio sp. 10N.222.54.B12 TaxID=3229636 RepID=UPI00354C5471
MKNNDAFIPVGDMLRQFLANPMIKAHDIKKMLQSRGVWSSSTEKTVLGPMLIRCGISPYEFEHLKDLVKEKEDNPKTQTKQLEWDHTQGSNLIMELGYEFDFSNLLNDPFEVTTVINTPEFTAAGDGTDPNHVVAEIKLKRRDMTKNFGEHENFYDCFVEMKVDENNQLALNVTTKHTSKESLAVANEVVRRATNVLNDSGLIKSKIIKRILFSDFSNTERIDFMRDLTKFTSTDVHYQDTKKIHIQPDDNVSTQRPNEIQFLEKKINDLTLKGSNLDSSVFLRLNKLKDHLKLYSMHCLYEVDHVKSKGSCDIFFEFPDADKKEKSELTISMTRLTLKNKLSSRMKNKIRLDILRELEKKKMTLFDKYLAKIASQAKASTPTP